MAENHKEIAKAINDAFKQCQALVQEFQESLNKASKELQHLAEAIKKHKGNA